MMKGMMIWCAALCACLVLVLGLAPATGALAQEETAEEGAPPVVEGEEGETSFDFADYFAQEWLDKLVQYVCVLLGAVTAIVGALRRVKKAQQALVKDSAELRERQQDLAQTQRRLEEDCAERESTVSAVREAVDACRTLREETEALREETKASLNALREAMGIAYCHDPDLVQNGCARHIAALLEVPHEEP